MKKETLQNRLNKIDAFREKEIEWYKDRTIKSAHLWGYISDEEYELAKKFLCDLAECKGIDVKTMINIIAKLKEELEHLPMSEKIF